MTQTFHSIKPNYKWIKIEQLLWKKKKSYKSFHDVLLLENNQHQDSNANCASCKAASHHPVVDHFPITAHRQVCYPVLYKISPGCKVKRDRIRNLFETHTSLSCFLLHHLICMMNCKWKLIEPCAR